MKATTSFLKWNLFPVPRICKLDIKAYQAEGLRDYLLEQSLSKKRKISQLYMSVQTKTAEFQWIPKWLSNYFLQQEVHSP